MAGQSWFIRLRGRVLGPFSNEQLITMRDRGQLTRFHEMSTDRKAWVTASGIPEFFPASTGSKTPTQPRAVEPAGYRVEDTTAPQDHSRSPNDPRASLSWYYAVGKSPHGPLSFDEIVKLTTRKVIRSDTPIWNETLPVWEPASRALSDLLVVAGQTETTGSHESREDRLGMSHAEVLGGMTYPQAAESPYGVLQPFVGLGAAVFDVIRYIFSKRLLTKRAVRWIIGFGLFPLVLFVSHQHLRLGLPDVVTLISIYFILFWAAFFQSLVRPAPGVWNRGIRWALFTIFIGIPILLVSAADLPVVAHVYRLTTSEDLFKRWVGFTFGVGLSEEFTKVLPFLLFVVFRRERIEPKTGLILGLWCGLGFAIVEALAYIVVTAFKVASAQALGQAEARHLAQAFDPSAVSMLYAALVCQQLHRFVTGPLLHACWAATNGWFIASATQKGSVFVATTVGLLLTTLLHGTFDTLASGDSLLMSMLAIGVAVLSLLIFLAYLAQALDQESEIPTG